MHDLKTIAKRIDSRYGIPFFKAPDVIIPSKQRNLFDQTLPLSKENMAEKVSDFEMSHKRETFSV